MTTASLMDSQNNGTYLRLHFAVVNNFSPENMLKIYSLREKIKDNVEFNYYNAKNVEKEMKGQASEKGSGLIAKLLLPHLVGKDVERLIIIDNGDLLVLRDLTEMYNWNMSNNIYMGSPDRSAGLFGKISKSLELQSQLLLDDIDAEFKSNRGNNINNMFINPYSTATTSSSISRDALFNNKQENKINEKIKQIIFLISDYNNYMIKFLHLLNKEIKDNKRNYMKLLKTNYDYELKINSQTKKLDDIKNDFEKYNISKKIRGEKVKENTIKNIKSQFLKKENEYLMHNFQLKDEIYSLVKLLDKNKGYFNKYKEAKKEINDNKKNVNLLRIEFNKELQDKNLEYALEKDQKEELIIKLEELEETIRELKEENDNNKRKEIETNAQILQLKIILGQKNENLKMMNEELEQYIREYEKEKHNYQNSQNSLRALENRIYNEEKQKEKESISNNNEFPI